jgi:hypothetical protein
MNALEPLGTSDLHLGWSGGSRHATSGKEAICQSRLKTIQETPQDDPRQQTDLPTQRQTDQPWKGNPEKEQLDPKRPPLDLERWQKSNTH